MKNKTRREFILDGTKVIGTVIFSSVAGQGLLFARDSEVKKSRFPEFSCGDKNKGAHSVLIAYASESGSTAEVAQAIGDTLCGKGYTVETKWIKTVKSINDYDAVIIGSPIIYENWMPEVREFVENNKEILKNMPVAYFITCMALSGNKEGGMQQAIEYSDKLCTLVPQIKPVNVGRFAGRLDYSKIPFFKRVLVKGAMAIHDVKEGDYRDWNAIRSWAGSINFQLN